MNRLFDFSWPSRDSGLFSGWSPALDVFDDKDNFVVKVELPGMKKDEIDLSLHDGVLTVSGERKHEREAQGGRDLPQRALLRQIPAQRHAARRGRCRTR